MKLETFAENKLVNIVDTGAVEAMIGNDDLILLWVNNGQKFDDFAGACLQMTVAQAQELLEELEDRISILRS